tara:strand:+ start:27 stop:608 length:582 start_codon:yes stop_codon:yes gene_type:complete
MKYIHTAIAVISIATGGCGQKPSYGDSKEVLNLENTNQGLEAEVARLKQENEQLKAALAGRNANPQIQNPAKPMPAGILSVDSKGRPTFSSLNPETAAKFYDEMHLDQIKRLYGNPITFRETTIANLRCNYAGYIAGHSHCDYPKNIYNAGTEKFVGAVGTFYFSVNTYKCVAIAFNSRLIITPHGKTLGMQK